MVPAGQRLHKILVQFFLFLKKACKMEQQTFQNDLKSILATSWKRLGPMLANVRTHNNASINIDIISERIFYEFSFWLYTCPFT